MSGWLADFLKLLDNRLLPEFCADAGRQCETLGFRRESIKIAEADARDFMRAFNGGLVEHQGRGLYRAGRSAASEQFFWEGRKIPLPRSFTLWLEPIITVAALARLCWDFGWPAGQIGTQSSDWAFDLVACRVGDENEYIAGEVKKSPAELAQLIDLMRQFGRDPNLAPPSSTKAVNAYKKVAGLRRRRAPVFWAVGPNELSLPFRVEYGPKEIVYLVNANQDVLNYVP